MNKALLKMENTDRLTLSEAGIACPKSLNLQIRQHNCNSVDLAGVQVSKQAVYLLRLLHFDY